MTLGPRGASRGRRSRFEGAGGAAVIGSRRAGKVRVARGLAGRPAVGPPPATGIPVMAAGAGRIENEGIPIGPVSRPWRDESCRRRLGWAEGSARARSRGGGRR